MASIYEITQQILGDKQKRQGGGNQYFNNALQIMNYIDDQDKKEGIALKEDATLLNSLIQGASTQKEIDNMITMTTQFGADTTGRPTLKLHNEIILSNAESKKNEFNESKKTLDWIDQKMNQEVPDYEGVYEAVTGFEIGKTGESGRALRHNNPGAHIWTPELANKYGATKGDPFTVKEDDGTGNFIEKTYNTAYYEDINKGTVASKFIVKKLWDASGGDARKFAEDYSGSSDADTLRNYENAVNNKVGKGSYFNYSVETMRDWSLDEIEARIREMETFEKGMDAFKSNKFEYNKGSYADATLMKEYEDYKQKLTSTLKAHKTAGIISEEEALSIMRGTYKQDKIETIKLIDKNISNKDTQIARLQKMRLDQMSDDAKGVLMDEFSGTTGANLQSKINNSISSLMIARNKEKERRYKWTGIESDAMGADFMEHNLSGDEGKGELLTGGEGGEVGEVVTGGEGGEVGGGFQGSKQGQLIFDMRENVNNLIAPYKEDLKKTVSSSKLKDTAFTSKDKERQKQKKISFKSNQYKSQLTGINSKLKNVEMKEIRARAQTKASPGNKYYKNQLDEALKEKRDLEMKKNDINKALTYTEAGLVSRKFEATDEDLFNLIVGGNLNLKDLGIPSDIIKEIKKSLRYYKAYIPHVSKNEINKYNFPRKINLNF